MLFNTKLQRSRFILSQIFPWLSLLGIWTGCHESTESESHPRVLNDEFRIELIAEDPDIMTPIGLTVDSQDDIYVLESHTHLEPEDYSGPDFDRIKKGVDNNQDGIPESWIIYADSIEDGMNLACDMNNRIFLTEKCKVWVFEDTDGDGMSDLRRLLLEMNPPENVYDHAGILGLTVQDDWLYVSRGNSGSYAWTITGTDGAILSGYGDGGNVIRCKTDGTGLEEVATGFWNPFDIKFTREGRLMLVDNDPDSRGPNRLIEVVPGGHYGYESLYGGSGIHPFLAWNGELPGTLPYAAALGEAPSGMLDASFTSLSSVYPDNILSTIWEEHTIVRVPLQPHQSTVKGEAEMLVQGDSSFHPVALATNSKGDIYISDWVIRQYPNHGKGKIWRLSSSRNHSQTATIKTQNDPDKRVFTSRYASWENEQELFQALRSEDPFIRTTARRQLISPAYRPYIETLLNDQNQQLRLQALIALSTSDLEPDQQLLKQLLKDNDKNIRQMALIYIARHGRTDLLPSVEQSMMAGYITSDLLETWLATIRHLQPDFVKAKELRSERHAKSIPRILPESFVWNLINNPNIQENLRAAAIPYLEQPDSSVNELLALYKTSSPVIQEALLRLFQRVNDESIAPSILQTVLNNQKSIPLRTQALITLSYQQENFCHEIKALRNEEHQLLTSTATRYLERCEEGTNAITAPLSDEEWAKSVNEKGDPENGKYIFQLSSTQCQNCHQVDGWGGHFGPDLSHVGSSKSRKQLIRAILQPSAEISPEWQGWFVVDENGQTHYGRQIDVGAQSIELMSPTGEFVRYPNAQRFGLAPTSLMPEGLELPLTPNEFNDLIAYLVSLK